jgi:phosphatidylglycerophosphate synthase
MRGLMDLDAVVIADRASTLRVHGLTLVERARRVAVRAGAKRVLVVDVAPDGRGELAGWWRGGRVVVVRAADQLVHTPLVAPLVAAPAPAIAIVPPRGFAPDLGAGDYAGAFIVDGAAAERALAALGRGDDDRDVAAALHDAGAAALAHGAVARHPVRDAGEARAAARMLEQILVKPQDNAITRYMYRPVSLPLTRLLARTPITPNQVSYAVGVLAAIGLWLTAQASMASAIAGTAVILLSSYVDCCDGEIARLKLLSSRYGAWLDTIIDELSSIGYMLAIGWHCHLYFGPNYLGPLGFDPWLVAMIASLATYLISLYCIYYNIIVVVGSANSQDYASQLEVVPGDAPNTVRLAPKPVPPLAPSRSLPRPIAAILEFAPNIVRRDFICWASLAFAVLHLTHVAFGVLALGGVVTGVIVVRDHARLRLARRAIHRSGQILIPR